MYRFPVLLLGFGLAACGNAQSRPSGGLREYDLSSAPSNRIELPGILAEVSGIAFTGDGRLLAQGDESAVVYQIDFPSGRVVKRFAIGDAGGPLLGDFEDIQVVGDRVFLVASQGQLVEAKEGADGTTVPVVSRTRGLKGGCEVEGLSWDEPTSSMLLLCKEAAGKHGKDHVVILAVNPATGEFEREPRILVSQAQLERVTGARRFSGSAIVRNLRTGTLILLAGPQRAFAEIDTSGKVLAGGRLMERYHRQPEGIAIAPDHTLLVSDEAAGATATITGYAARR
jgi:uncharacterized protein YjiK